MNILSGSQIRALPKVDLHRHLDCSMRWSTLCELAGKNPAPRREDYLITEPMFNLETVLRKFLTSQKLLSSPEILTRLAYEACEDAYNDGVLILELRYAPTFVADGHPELNFEKIHQAFLKGIALAQKKWPIAVGLIGIVQRTKPIQEAASVIDFIIENKKTFIAVDLADNEENFNPKPYAPLFNKAKSHGLHVTIHSGETTQKQSASWVKDSVDLLGAERIGHGIQIINDLEITNWIRNKKIPLEICPWSNYLTQAFPKLEDHPLRKLWNSGVLITLGSDDPGIFDSRLSDDYEIAQRVHKFTSVEFFRANDIATTASFIPYAEKQKVWPRPIEKEY